MRLIKKLPTIHPILFVVFPLLFLYSQNKEELLPGELLIPVAAVAILTPLFLFLWFLLGFVFKNREKAAFITSTSIFLFYSYGHFYSFIKDFGIHLGSFIFGPNKILFTLYTLVLFILGYLLFKSKRDLGRLTDLVNFVAFLLVLISIVDILPHEIAVRRSVLDYQVNDGDNKFENISLEGKSLPDIYYIVLDGYARSDILENTFNYDNSEFIDYLKEKGFYVASRSNSNYALTGGSLPSTLHMEYIDDVINYLKDKLGVKPKDIQMIEDNKVVPFLKLRGYKFINVSSGWIRTEYIKTADINLGSGYFLRIGDKFLALNEFSVVFLRTTALKPFIEPLIADNVRQKILYSFKELTEIPNMIEPTFVFAHYMMPHPPYLFDRDGKPVPRTELELAGGAFEDKKHYLDQLIFANKKTKEVVDAILSKSSNPPIIIIQADHGPFSTLGDPSKWASRVNRDAITERMGILNAYYLPHGGDKLLYDSITPVNTFRLIFNFYFGANYNLLSDEIYFSCYSVSGCPFKRLNVTETVRSDQ